ncbi:MAG: amidohydrolase family protein [Acidobacteria bacterium]|nr:amidohydrolase family protein [Acidobacteriota bacterium]
MRHGYRSLILLCAVVDMFLCAGVHAQNRHAIIDVHVHALPAPRSEAICPLSGLSQTKYPDGTEVCAKPFTSPVSAEDLRQQTLQALSRHNILAVTFGPDLSVVEAWRKERPDRIVPAIQTTGVDVDIPSLRRLLESGTLSVIGEVTSQYAGLTPGDPKLEPLFALAEELDRPVGIHIAGIGGPIPGYRVALGDPLLLEPVLLRHPKLRVYVMHAGFPFLESMVALLRHYPGVYVDISLIDWQLPRSVFHQYLKGLVDHGFGKRVMFGTDHVSWPQAFDVAIEGVRSAKFLSDEQKRDIFYNNAARFLRLEEKGQTKPVSKSKYK